MTTIQIILCILAILLIGFIRTYLKYRVRRKEISFAKEYQQNYRKFVQQYLKNHFDGDTYEWLTSQSAKMQLQLGIFGQVDYRPPYANYIHRNYQMLLNTLPEMRNGIVHNSDIGTLDDMMTRYIGWKEDNIQSYFKQFFNPFAWLREGVQFIIILPLRILEWIGVLDEVSVNTIDNSSISRFIAAFVSFIGFAGTVIGITVDWEQFSRMLKMFIDKYL